jgi:hypothetical protein
LRSALFRFRRVGYAGLILLLAGPCSAQEIPAGTLLPVQLNHDLKVEKSKAGQRVSATLMQDVAWQGMNPLRKGATVEGRVAQAQSASAGGPARLVLVIDSVQVKGHAPVRVQTSLRALASQLAVFNAELPTN